MKHSVCAVLAMATVDMYIATSYEFLVFDSATRYRYKTFKMNGKNFIGGCTKSYEEGAD
jgi:hypothetical protein